MNAPSDPPGAPLQGNRPAPPEPGDRGRSLASEAGLLLLSLVLALMVWSLVRNTVAAKAERDVVVRARAPEGTRAVGVGSVHLALSGTRGEIDGALAELERRGRVLDLAIGPLREGETERPLHPSVDRVVLPFAERLLDNSAQPPMPTGLLLRLESRLVAIRPPEVRGLDSEGLIAEVELARTSLEVVYPHGALEGDLVPDPIDGSALRQEAEASLSVPQRVTLRFEGWKAGRLGAAVTPDVIARRAEVALEPVTATVTLAPSETRPLTSEVLVWLRRSHELLEIKEPTPERGVFQGGALVRGPSDPPIAVSFTAPVRATKDVMKELAAADHGWRWVLSVPDEDLPQDEPEQATLRATLHFVPIGSWRADLDRGRIQPPEVRVQVVVRRTR